MAPDEKLIPRLLIDSPALPHEGVMAFLRDVISSGGDWATLALSSAYDITMKRPPDRAPALQVILEAATGPNADIRCACHQHTSAVSSDVFTKASNIGEEHCLTILCKA